MSWTRVRAIFRKELREYRRNGFILATMAIVPLFFIVLPLIEVFAAPASTPAAHSLLKGGPHLHARDPGHRADDGGGLRHRRGTPAGHARARAVDAGAPRGVHGGQSPGRPGPFTGDLVRVVRRRTGLRRPVRQPRPLRGDLPGPELLAQAFFTPLIAGWSVSSSIAISARSSDVRVAQQLGSLVSLPPLAMAVLVSFYVVHPTVGLVLGLAAVLVVVDALGWKAMLAMFNRERLVTATKV